jgi:quinol-cytochrome oxidoreductase complex cytochrome b subunit
MRLDERRKIDLERRRGQTWRTILAGIWLALCIWGATWLTDRLFASGTLSANFFYNDLFIPRTVSPEIIRVGVIIVVVVLVQFFVLIGYGLTSPIGRLRPDNPTPYTRNPEPEDKFHYR